LVKNGHKSPFGSLAFLLSPFSARSSYFIRTSTKALSETERVIYSMNYKYTAKCFAL